LFAVITNCDEDKWNADKRSGTIALWFVYKTAIYDLVTDCRVFVAIFLIEYIKFIQRASLFWVIAHRVLIISYQCVGGSCPLKMGPIGFPEMLVRNDHYSLRNNPEEHRSYRLRGGSLKLRKIYSVCLPRVCDVL